jgi:hypothetical protein
VSPLDGIFVPQEFCSAHCVVWGKFWSVTIMARLRQPIFRY